MIRRPTSLTHALGVPGMRATSGLHALPLPAGALRLAPVKVGALCPAMPSERGVAANPVFVAP